MGMTPEFLQSIALVIVGAAITLSTTLIVERLRGRQEDRRETERREVEEGAKLREQGLSHTLAVHDILNQLQLALSGRVTPTPQDELMLALRGRYLLVPDTEVRSALAVGLTLAARQGQGMVEWNHVGRAMTACSFIVAAYLRGGRPPARYVSQLADLRALYETSGESEAE
ncbi:hypothetical protein [Agromyces albus]|uniref:hypothetical protein n=1 Tax=Agromyces albus TaxID=205332 RepID=UPI00278B857A|nr:hypothetical protein [Agromyces albus]MDQ0576457.1 hypothetical protein [Agromyces albus]